MRYLLLLLALPLLMGASGGPQVLDDLDQRRFARGPWVSSYESDESDLACDMASDTCSDGRKITTTRSTPVPCEVAPGQWEMVGVDEGCYGVRGLESWAATTSYLSFGAELDREPWRASPRGGTLEPITDGWRVSKALDEPNSGWNQRITGMGDGAMWTTSYILRTMTPIPMALYAGSSQNCGQKTLDTGGQWQILSCSREVPAPSDPAASIYPGANTTGTPYSVDVKAAWTVRGDTPGRACWGGEAPVTCARDYHRMSATGFPATTGEISWVMSLERVPDGGEALRGIVWADGAAVPNRISLTGGGGIQVYTGETTYITGPLSWEPGRSYRLQLILTDDEWKVIRDGALVGSTPPLGSMDWGATVRLGDLLDGSISSLRVRSAE